MATSLKALKERLPIPSLADWLLTDPERVHNLYNRHSESTSGRCTECSEIAPCKFYLWAVEAQEYLEVVNQRNGNRIRNGKHYE